MAEEQEEEVTITASRFFARPLTTRNPHAVEHYKNQEYWSFSDPLWRPLRGKRLQLALAAQLQEQIDHVRETPPLIARLRAGERSADRYEQIPSRYFARRIPRFGTLMAGTVRALLKSLDPPERDW